MMDLSELTNKISALKVFKDQINTAVKDEQEAQRIYDKMMTYARQARTSSGISEIQVIKDQERDHETKFKRMLNNTEASITEFERMMKEEEKRKQAEDKRRKEERQRKEQEARRTGTGRR